MIRILKLKLKMYLLLLVVYAAVVALSWLGFRLFAPSYMEFFPALSVFYFVTGLVYNYALDRCRRQPNKLVATFMVARMVKFLLTIAFLVIGIKVFCWEKTPFAIVLMCNYFLYMGLELHIFRRYSTWHSKRRKRKNAKKNV
jgi:F0F1-type ATP synthase assembly protein I